jgi:hypothetical protein
MAASTKDTPNRVSFLWLKDHIRRIEERPGDVQVDIENLGQKRHNNKRKVVAFARVGAKVNRKG